PRHAEPRRGRRGRVERRALRKARGKVSRRDAGRGPSARDLSARRGGDRAHRGGHGRGALDLALNRFGRRALLTWLAAAPSAHALGRTPRGGVLSLSVPYALRELDPH